ncbi:MAG: YbaB/EbfC family nucleoid-associated protein [Gemmatimonadota bacterium]|nr:YbaB/EbfC family nucleoid-associated protein [Gemmatimonadota bacterium]
MANIAQLLKQAQQMQGKFKKMQVELENKKVEATSGGGMVRAVVNGRQELLQLRIDPEVVDPKDVEMLEELVAAAVNNAMEKAREILSEEMSKVTGGISLPGFFNNILGG